MASGWKLRSFIPNLSFRQKLLLFSTVMSIVPVLVLGILSSVVTTESIQAEVNRNHQVILQQLEDQVDSFMRSLDKASLALANSQTIQKSLQAGISMTNPRVSLDMIDVINNIKVTAETDFEVSLYYLRFNLIYSSALGIIRDPTYPYTEIISLIGRQAGGLNMIPLHTYASRSEMLLIRGVPLGSPNPDGYLILQLPSEQIKRLLDRLNLGGHRKIVIVNDQGEVLTSRDMSDTGSQLLPTAPLYPYWITPGLLAGSLTMDGVDYNVSSLRSRLNDWTYIALTPSTELTAKARHIRSIMWLITAGSFLLWSAVAVIGSRRLYFPIERIAGKFAGRQPQMKRDGLRAIDEWTDHMLARNERLETQLSETQPLMKEYLLQRLLSGHLQNGETIRHLYAVGPPLPEHWHYVLIVEIDRYVSFHQQYNENDRFLLLYAMRNVIEELSAQRLASAASVAPRPGQIVLIAGSPAVGESLYEQLVLLCDDIREQVKAHLSLTVTTAIGSPRQGIGGIREAYLETLELLQYRWIAGPDRTIGAEQLAPSVQQSGRALAAWQNAIATGVMEGELDAARNQLDEMVESIPRALQNPQSICGLFALLIGEIDRRMHEHGYRQTQDMFEYNLLDYLYSLSSMQEVRSWMADTVFPAIHELLRTHATSHSRKLIAEVQAYIREQYETDLSLQMIADRFGISPSTLSRMFKKESGVNYLDFIIQVRMDKAKEWLLHSDMTIREMTDRLRYTTVHNFTRIFKQYTGLPPGSFRKKHYTGS
ncbi:helix-turn-helix domain-containing protein [Paenibacillus cymbidii]|uniref:helix-turn-helix domain-containing protein n=1 Tax=Paenibacillus cymbidii TaxID=1639034 RepID=UPI001080E46E|nr:helix-turn-helix domain-containing protein [Paenibacillus cymbidii]